MSIDIHRFSSGDPQLQLLITSDDDQLIRMFEDLSKQASIEYQVCKSLETFIAICWRKKFRFGIIDLALFKRHNLHFSRILKHGLFGVKLVVINTDDQQEKEIIEARFSQIIMYRFIKPISTKEASTIINVIKGSHLVYISPGIST